MDADILATDTQWFNIPLTLPVSDDAGRIRSISVCMRTNGGAYISQTRLTEQMVPGSAFVVFDDGTDRRDPAGGCYTVNVGDRLPGGVMTLRLRVAMPNASTDSIELTGGMVTMARR